MILVDLEAPVGATSASLAPLVERWGQTVRHSLAAGRVAVGDVRGVVMELPAAQVLAGLDLASTVLSADE